MGKAVHAQATSKNGNQLTVHSQETDAPILPVAQLQQLHEFRPDLVDFVIEQTKQEAEHRRRQDSRVNFFIFVERLVGQLAAVLVAVMGIGGGIYAGLNGQPLLGTAIASVTIGTLAVAFLRRQQAKAAPPSTTKK